jgi:hypothetical protein
MKRILLVALLLPVVLMAQLPQPQLAVPGRLPQPPGYRSPAETLPDNYQVTLNLADKDGTSLEISVVIASSQFNATLGEQNLNFSGTVTVEESGSIVIAYGLGWQTPVPSGSGSTQYQSSSTQGSVRLKLGEEVQIIRAGTRTARLSIKRLEPAKTR